MFERNHTPELLAPAGGRAQLEAAVHFGADAVYFACDRFGLRQRAENFALDEVPYNSCRIKGEAPEVLAARLKLSDTVRAVIANCLALLGVSAPEKM